MSLSASGVFEKRTASHYVTVFH